MTLEKFDEPSWNNPVVQTLSSERTMLPPRLADDYTVGGLALTMVTAFRAEGRDMPASLEALVEAGAAQMP